MLKKLALKFSRKPKKSEKSTEKDPVVCYACEGSGLSKGSLRRTSTISCANRFREVEFDICEICEGNKLIPAEKTL